MSDYIFEFNEDKGHSYKGVLTGFLEEKSIFEYYPFMMPSKGFNVEILGIVWTDENACCHWKMRLKFPSGNKQVISKSYGEDYNEETAVQDMCRIPMRNKEWIRNPDGTLMSLINILRENDMVLSERIEECEKKDANIHDNRA